MLMMLEMRLSLVEVKRNSAAVRGVIKP